MKNNKQWLKAFFSAFVVWTIFMGSVPIRSQDIVTSEDIAGGSSVFVFRQSRKSAQVKAAFRGNGGVKNQPSARARRKIIEQAKVVSAPRKRAPKIDPNSVAANRPNRPNRPNNTLPVNSPARIKESNQLAGIGESFLDMNQVDEAVFSFKQAIETYPKNENAKLGLSEALTRQGDQLLENSKADLATANYLQAISYNSQNAAAYAGLGQAYEAVNNNDKAIENYEKALAINSKLVIVNEPLGKLYLQKGEIAKADNYLSRAYAADPNDSELEFYVGMVRYRQGRNEEAIEKLKKALAVNQNSAENHYYLGAAYDRLDNESEASKEYNEAIRLNRNYLEAWFDLGVMHYNRGRYDEAVKAYKEALRVKNDHAPAHANLADTYRQMAIDAKDREQKRNLFELANSSYTLAAVFIKDDAELYSNWAFCLGRVEKWDTAIERLNTAVAIKPAAADYSNIGWASLNSAQIDRANNKEASAKTKLENGKSALQKAIAMNQKLSGAFVNLGMISNELGEYQAAVNALQTALSMRGGDWWVLNHELGFGYRQLNDLENAVKFFKKTTQLKSDYADAWYNLGEVEHLRGNKKEAKQAFDKLKKLDPRLANRLDAIMKGAILTNPKNQIENKIQEKNPLNKIPRPF